MKGHKMCPDHPESFVGQGGYYCKDKGHPVADPTIGYPRDGKDMENGIVTLDASEQQAFVMDSDKTIKLRAFVELHTIDPTLYEQSYMCWPQDDAARESYGLLYHVLCESGKALVGEGVFWGTLRTFVVAWNEHHECLTVSSCNYYANLNEHDLDEVKAIRLHETDELAVKLAEQLLDSLPDTYPWDETRDVVADRQRAIIEEKAKTGVVTVPETPFEAGEIPDIIESLRASLAAV